MIFSVHPELDNIGVRGGEEDVQQNEEGKVSHGGCTSRAESHSANFGKQWRDGHCDEIARQHLFPPRSNWYRVNNRMFEKK